MSDSGLTTFGKERHVDRMTTDQLGYELGDTPLALLSRGPGTGFGFGGAVITAVPEDACALFADNRILSGCLIVDQSVIRYLNRGIWPVTDPVAALILLKLKQSSAKYP